MCLGLLSRADAGEEICRMGSASVALPRLRRHLEDFRLRRRSASTLAGTSLRKLWVCLRKDLHDFAALAPLDHDRTLVAVNGLAVMAVHGRVGHRSRHF